jgi:hypothetical protein
MIAGPVGRLVEVRQSAGPSPEFHQRAGPAEIEPRVFGVFFDGERPFHKGFLGAAQGRQSPRLRGVCRGRSATDERTIQHDQSRRGPARVRFQDAREFEQAGIARVAR